AHRGGSLRTLLSGARGERSRLSAEERSMTIDAKTLERAVLALIAAASVYSGANSQQAANLSGETLAAARQEIGKAYVDGFQMCVDRVEGRIERGAENVVPPVPKALREMAAQTTEEKP
ncbi:MAG: hypothetical protein WA001_02015, partial [Patescibacteria group bacterium]